MPIVNTVQSNLPVEFQHHCMYKIHQRCPGFIAFVVFFDYLCILFQDQESSVLSLLCFSFQDTSAFLVHLTDFEISLSTFKPIWASSMGFNSVSTIAYGFNSTAKQPIIPCPLYLSPVDFLATDPFQHWPKTSATGLPINELSPETTIHHISVNSFSCQSSKTFLRFHHLPKTSMLKLSTLDDR